MREKDDSDVYLRLLKLVFSISSSEAHGFFYTTACISNVCIFLHNCAVSMFCLYIIYSFDFLPQISHFEGRAIKYHLSKVLTKYFFTLLIHCACHNNEVRDLKADMVGRSSRRRCIQKMAENFRRWWHIQRDDGWVSQQGSAYKRRWNNLMTAALEWSFAMAADNGSFATAACTENDGRVL